MLCYVKLRTARPLGEQRRGAVVCVVFRDMTREGYHDVVAQGESVVKQVPTWLAGRCSGSSQGHLCVEVIRGGVMSRLVYICWV